ncbi:MAG: hypothetical protein IJA07_01930 [Agathobacter sp.]|nr:hypothetical protein [Agathobacter sp.]
MSVENLQLMAIKEQSLQAYNATEKLVGNMNVLSTMLKKVDVTSITCISNTLVQSKDTAKEAAKNTLGFASAIEKIGQKMPNVRTVIDGITKKYQMSRMQWRIFIRRQRVRKVILNHLITIQIHLRK